MCVFKIVNLLPVLERTDSPNELVLHGHSAPVVACDWMCDGRQLVTGSWDHTALLWDCDTGQTIHTLKGKSPYHCEYR